MHIAICIWGILRSLTFTIQSIEDFCLNPILNHGHTYEIFLHTYNFSGDYKNLRNHEKSVKLNFSEWKLLSPDHVYIENQDKFDLNVGYSSYMTQGDPWNNNYTSFKNHLRALNSLRQLALAVETVGKTTHFDGVVYLRPDVTYISELPIYLLESYRNTLFLADFHRSCKGGEYNDRMAMGDYNAGITYGKKFDAALSYSLTHKLHSEKFTHDFIVNNGVKVVEMPFRFRRTRAAGEIHIRDQAVYSPSDQNRLVKHNAIPHKTNYFLRCIYAFIETVTFGQMYVWNQDDDENQFCTPHKHVSYSQLQTFRKASLKKAEINRKNGVLPLKINISKTYKNDADNSGTNVNTKSSVIATTQQQKQFAVVDNDTKNVIITGDAVVMHKNSHHANRYNGSHPNKHYSSSMRHNNSGSSIAHHIHNNSNGNGRLYNSNNRLRGGGGQHKRVSDIAGDV